MADIDLQGRPANQIPEPKEDTNAKVTEVVDKTSIPEGEQKAQQPSGMVPLIQSRQGNELTVLIQVLSGINRNLAFLAKTIHDHVNQKASQKNG